MNDGDGGSWSYSVRFGFLMPRFDLFAEGASFGTYEYRSGHKPEDVDGISVNDHDLQAGAAHEVKVSMPCDMFTTPCAAAGGHVAGAICWIRSNALDATMQTCAGKCEAAGLNAHTDVAAWAAAIQASTYHEPLRDALCGSGYTFSDPNSDSYWNKWSPTCEASNTKFWVTQQAQTEANWSPDARFTTEESGGRKANHARLCPCKYETC